MRGSEKVKTICRCAVFLLILAGILAGLSGKIMSEAKKNSNLIQSRERSFLGIQKEPENSIDVLVVGDSESYSSISPMQMWKSQGITSFVCGQPGQKIQESYYMLKTAFETQSPKLVILETNVIFRAQKGLDGVGQFFAQTGNYYFPVFQYHDAWKSLMLGEKYAAESYKGFVLKDTIEAYNGGDYMKETDKKEKISDLVSIYMDQVMELCKENGAQLMLLSVPSPVNYDYARHNTLTEYAQNNGLDYVNLNLQTKALDIDWKTDTTDKGDHLNLSGAQKVTAYVGELIKDKYQLEGHLGDLSYQDWDTAEQGYSAQVDKTLDTMQLRYNVMRK